MSTLLGRILVLNCVHGKFEGKENEIINLMPTGTFGFMYDPIAQTKNGAITELNRFFSQFFFGTSLTFERSRIFSLMSGGGGNVREVPDQKTICELEDDC